MMKILIVDDQSATLESLGMYFSEQGYEVLTAPTGAEGIAKAASFSPDIIILDIRLPDKNGIDVLQEMRELNEDFVVFMITAFHDMDTTIRAMKHGAYDYVHKPVDIRELGDKVQRVAQRIAISKKLSNSGRSQAFSTIRSMQSGRRERADAGNIQDDRAVQQLPGDGPHPGRERYG